MRHLPGLLAALAVFVLYAPTIAYDFEFDDGLLIAGNANLSWDRVPVLLTSAYWRIERDAVPEGQRHMGGMYRPVVSMVSLIDKSVAGGKPWVFHLTNVLAHALCVFLLYLFLLEWVAAGWQAALLALLWGVHPMHTEVVAFVSGRTDGLANLFLLAALLLYRRGPAVAFALALALALGSKETSAFLLPLLMLLHFVKTTPWRLWHWVSGIAVMWLWIAFRAQATQDSTALPVTFVRSVQILPDLAIMSLQHIAVIVIPWRLTHVSVFASRDLTLLIFEAVLVAWMLRRWWPGLVWCLLFFIPTAFGAMHVYGGLVECISSRFLSFASIGVVLWLAVLLRDSWRPFTVAAVSIFALSCAAQTAWCSTVYRDESTFWDIQAHESPQSDVVAYNHGLMLMKLGRYDECVAETRRCVRINPRYFAGNPYLNIATCYRIEGRLDDAQKTILEGLQVWPGSPILLQRLQELSGR